MPRNEPDKDPIAHSERMARGEHKPHDPLASAQAHTEHSRADWEKRAGAGQLHAHEQAPQEPTPEVQPEEPATLRRRKRNPDAA